MYKTYFYSDNHRQWFQFTLDSNFNVIFRKPVARPELIKTDKPFDPQAKKAESAIHNNLKTAC